MMKTSSTTQSDFTFTIDVLRVFAEFDSCDDVWWRTDDEYAPVTFLVNCNDVFFWGTADCEQVTPENLALLRAAYSECEALKATWCAARLFCCRVRKMRPQGAAYPEERELWGLFDACGPERETGMGNPQKHPSKRESA